MTAPDAAVLAVLLRQAQWLLDDAARDVPAGRLTAERGEELASILDDLAAVMRRHNGRVVIDTDERGASR